MPYVPYETELFTKQRESNGDKEWQEQMTATIKRLIEHPELNDGPLHGNRSGTFKKKFFHKRWRILFRYCDFCIKVKKQQCDDCIRDKIPANAIIFLEMFERDEGY